MNTQERIQARIAALIERFRRTGNGHQIPTRQLWWSDGEYLAALRSAWIAGGQQDA